jgi:hypothetical protein
MAFNQQVNNTLKQPAIENCGFPHSLLKITITIEKQSTGIFAA